MVYKEVEIFISESPEVIEELEKKYGRPIKMGRWVLDERIFDILTQPVLKGKKENTFLTFKAIQELYPDVKYYKGRVLFISKENGNIFLNVLPKDNFFCKNGNKKK